METNSENNDSSFTATTPTSSHTSTIGETQTSIAYALETPKAVASNRKRDALLWANIYHLPPVIVTVVYTIAYARNWTWPYPGPSQETLAALQFAAKVHERIVVASLATILYHRIRFLMLRSEGIPLGLVTSPFQMSGPLYFLSPEFLGSLRTLFKRLPLFITLVLLCFVAVLSVLASPFSAILLIPRKLVFPVPKSHWLMSTLLGKTVRDGEEAISWMTGPADQQNGYLFETLPMPADGQYPTSMGLELGVKWNCPDIPAQPGNCVSYFQDLFPDLFMKPQGGGYDYVDLPLDPQGILAMSSRYKITARSPSAALSPMEFLIEESFAKDGAWNSMKRVTCPLRAAAFTLGGMQSGFRVGMANHMAPKEQLDIVSSVYFAAMGETLPTKQPHVLEQSCAHYFYSNNVSVEALTSAGWHDHEDKDTFQACFGTGWYPAFQFTMPEAIANLVANQDWQNGFTLFIDLQSQIPFPISGGYISVDANRTSKNGRQLLTIGFFVAQWAESEPTSWTSVNRVLSAISPGELSKPPHAFLNSTADTIGPVVSMNAEWLNSLDIFPFEVAPADDMPRLDNRSRSQFTQFRSQPGSAGGLAPFVAAIMSASHLEFNGLPRQRVVCCAPGPAGCIPSSFGPPGTRSPIVYEFAHAVPEDVKELAANKVEVRVNIEHQAYGYAFRGRTIVLSFVFLYLHVLLVVSHLIIVATGCFWTSTAWSSMSQLLVLGMRSTASDFLSNAGAGVGNWRTWSSLASVRVVEKESGQHVELFVCDPSRDSGQGKLGRSKVKVNVKYN